MVIKCDKIIINIFEFRYNTIETFKLKKQLSQHLLEKRSIDKNL